MLKGLGSPAYSSSLAWWRWICHDRFFSIWR